MKWSWRIATVAGIGIYLHVTFLLVLVWVAGVYFLRDQSIAEALYGLVLVSAVFTIVVMHELGHALTARRFGIQTRDITLLPIGGLARLERMPDKPMQELLVALAGPAVNVALAVLIFAILLLVGMPTVNEVGLIGPSVSGFLAMLVSINIALAVFNMLPAFPMDGGRVLRAVLALRLDYLQATQIAATVGQVMAFLFFMYGILATQPILLLIAVFVWMGASAEASMVQIKGVLGGVPVNRAMIREFRTLSPHDQLQVAIDHVLAGFQQDFPVTEEGRLVGVLTRSAMLSALASQGAEGLVGDAMERQFETADPAEMLDGAFARLQSCNCRSVPVVRNGVLVGMLTLENVGEFMMVQSALHNMPAPRVQE